MSFEKEYYESPDFWSGSMLSDESNAIRIKTTVDLIPSDCTSLLDVGCGNGKFINKIKEERTDIRVVGTDRSVEALQYVDCEKFESEITSVPKEDHFVDCISCLQVLEHIHHPFYNQSLKELARLAKKYIIISVPYKEDLEKSFTKCPQCNSNFSWELHLRSYNDNSIENHFNEFGFEMVKSVNIIKSYELVGQSFINKVRKFFAKKIDYGFRSPICIVCGYKEIKESASTANEVNAVAGVQASGRFSFIKKWWPKKEKSGYWIIALYKRVK